MITVTINGKSFDLDQPTTVQAYLELKGLAGRQLAVAVNGVVLVREDFAATLVNDGDRMEIVRPVGGGAGSVGPGSRLPARSPASLIWGR